MWNLEMDMMMIKLSDTVGLCNSGVTDILEEHQEEQIGSKIPEECRRHE